MAKTNRLWTYIKNRLPLLLLAVCIMTCAIASAIYAKYVKAQEQEITLDITGSAKVEIVVTNPSGTAYTVTNSGNIPVYVRFAVIVNWSDAPSGGNLFYTSPSSYTVDVENCSPVGNYYYYNAAIAAGSTVDIISKIEADLATAPSGYENLDVQVLAEAIQVYPDAVGAAWGVTFNGTGWAAVTP